MPVIRNVETMNYALIEKNIHSLGEKVSLVIYSHVISLKIYSHVIYSHVIYDSVNIGKKWTASYRGYGWWYIYC